MIDPKITVANHKIQIVAISKIENKTSIDLLMYTQLTGCFGSVAACHYFTTWAAGNGQKQPFTSWQKQGLECYSLTNGCS